MKLELKSDFPLVLAVLLDTDPLYGAPVKRRFLSLLMKIYFPPYELFGFAFLEFPSAAFPDIFTQFFEIVRLLDKVNSHVVPPVKLRRYSPAA
jgi:hypothetical protein